MNFDKIVTKVSPASNMLFLRELSIGNHLKGITSQHVSLLTVLQLSILLLESLTNPECSVLNCYLSGVDKGSVRKRTTA